MSETVVNNHFTAANATEHARNGHIARRAKSPRKAYDQAIQLQQLILRDAILDDLKPITRAAIARAWCELEEAKRKLKMKPLPGSLRPSEAKPRRKAKDPVSFTPAPDCGVSTPPNSVPDSLPYQEHTTLDSTQ